MIRRRALLLALAARCASAGEARPRARDLGLRPGVLPPGARNAITDVAGVKVGHCTLIEDEHVRTGVTAILPHGGNLFQEKVAGAVFVGNAFGKLAGSKQVEELGTIETPIVLTNTLSVGTAVEALVRYTLDQPGNERVQSVNALVGETNDGRLNDIRGMHVKREHVLAAIRTAAADSVEEGSVGAGTGTVCFGWKGGIGTASRRTPEGYTVGALVQSNFGGDLTMGGIPVGRELRGRPSGGSGDGSCMIVASTDAPLDARDLRRLAARAVFGLARTGSSYSHGSGDFAIAFTTAPELRVRFGERGIKQRGILASESASPLFQAALEAVEEAVYNSLLRAVPVGGGVEAIPIGSLRDLLRRAAR
jgi:D-aminopeptidase